MYGELLTLFSFIDHAVLDADKLQEDINQKLRVYSKKIADKDEFLKKLFFENISPTMFAPDEDFQADFKKVCSFFGIKQVHFVKRALMALITCAGWGVEIATRCMKALIDYYTILRKFLFPSTREYALECPSRCARSISSYLQARVGEQVFQTTICFLGQRSKVKV